MSKTAISRDFNVPNDVGKEKIVLPGYEAIALQDKAVLLGGGRTITWQEDSLLPDKFFVNGREFVQSQYLVHRDGKHDQYVSQVNRTFSLNSEGHDLEAIGLSMMDNGIRLESTWELEYDGLITLTLTISANQPTPIGRLFIRTEFAAGPDTRALRFHAANIRKRKKQFVFPATYSGERPSALAIADGNHSYWLVSDADIGVDARNEAEVELSRMGDTRLALEEVLLSNTIVKEPRKITLHYMLTPVREARVHMGEGIALNNGAEEGKYGDFNLWWIDGFVHETLPYTSFPAGTRSSFPLKDQNIYPGAEETKKKLRNARNNGVEPIPYFSAHALSAVDPAFLAMGERWQVKPPYVIQSSSDGPFTSKLKRPYLSHRSASYTDYLLERFSKLIDETGIAGLYFDQGIVIDSIAPEHAWTDTRGIKRSGTDILAMRMFFKRLATLFHTKGKPGYIFAHNSASPIVPAYSFVTAMVQGEEYRQRVQYPDYVKGVDIDELRTAYGSNQFGVPTYWLSTLWSKHMRPDHMDNKREWLKSDQYRKAHSGYQGLALIHNIPTWSLASLSDRMYLKRAFEGFRNRNTQFHGYWERIISTENKSFIYQFCPQ